MLQLLAFFNYLLLSICFPNWQMNSVFYSVYVSDDKWQHLCITVMHVTSNTWTVTVPCVDQNSGVKIRKIHTRKPYWDMKLAVEQMENWITFLTPNLVVVLFWFLGTRDIIMFVSHTHKCEWLRGLSLYTLDQFASVVSIFY